MNDAKPEIINTATFDNVAESFSHAETLELLDAFVQDTRRWLERIEGCLLDPDLEPLRYSVHSLVSAARAIGAAELQRLGECCKTLGSPDEYRRLARILLSEGEAALSRFVRAARSRLDAQL